MVGPRDLPKRAELVDYKNAVAGHAGTMSDPGGSLFIKPCTQAEIDFYENARTHHPEFADIMPLYLGALMLTEATEVPDITEQLPAAAEPIPPEVKEALSAAIGQERPLAVAVPVPASAPTESKLSQSASTPAAPAAPAPAVDNDTWVPRGSQSITTDRAVVLENATYGYKKPNILDVKLGQRLWADDAPRQKRDRLDAVRAETTHDKLGFRIAGMRVYKGSEQAEELDDEDYKIYDKDYGRYDVNNDNVVEAFRKFVFNKNAGIDSDHARAIALAFKTDLERVCRVMEKERTRMFSASLLFVFEGDGEALRTAIEDASASASATSSAASAIAPRSRSRREAPPENGKPSDRSTSRTDSGIAMEEDDNIPGEIVKPTSLAGVLLDSSNVVLEPASQELAVPVVVNGETVVTIEDIVGLNGGDAVEEEEDSDDDIPDPPPIYGLRLIDFAHAKFVPEQQHPDENNLVGVRSLIRIFDELST